MTEPENLQSENQQSENPQSQTPQNERRSHARVLSELLKGSRALFLLCMLASAVSALCDMISPQIVRLAVDYALGGADPSNLATAVQRLAERFGGFAYLGKHIWIMAAALLVTALVKAASEYGYRVSKTAASERLAKTTRDRLFRHIGNLPYAWHAKHRTGDIIQRCTSDLETLKNFLAEQLTEVLRIVILLLLSVCFMFSMNTRLALIALIPVPVIVGYSLWFHHRIGEGFLACDENEGILSAMAQENLAGVRVVRAFGRERQERDRFQEQNRYYTSLWMKLARPLAAYWSCGDILSGLQILLTVCFGAVFCIRGELLAGEYIAFLSYCAMMTWPVRALGRMISEMSKAGVSLERIAQILDAAEEPKNPAGLKPDLGGDIVFDHVSFSYEPEQEVLRDVSFTVPGGTTLGILGGTGSGKTTLILLLGKLFPLEKTDGSIRIGGVDLREMDTAWLRQNMAIVLQEPFLFSRTIRENLLMAEETDTDTNTEGDMDAGADTNNIDRGPDTDTVTDQSAAMQEALQAACLDTTIERFPDGMNTFIGERGMTLSGGQKQRLAIARALLRKPPILVLDDSLSAVDAETDARIRANLADQTRNQTVILISHRVNTLKNADRILVLDHGQTAEYGTHEELRQAGGLYQRICEIQEAVE